MAQSQASAARIALVRAGGHREIVEQGGDGFLSSLEEWGYPADRTEVFSVPGALEIPLQAKYLAATGRISAIVAMAFVEDGGIYRHEFVAGTVIDALMQVQLESRVPILSAVRPPQQFHGHAEHRAFFHEHFRNKGREVGNACAETITNLAVFRMEGLRAPFAPGPVSAKTHAVESTAG